MKEEEIEGLLDEASGLYNDGRYDEAIAIWHRILEAHPDHERAQEGIKMANLLTSDWEQASAPPPGGAEAAAPEPPSKIQAGIKRVEELLAAGNVDSAKEGVEALLSVAPQDPEVVACVAKVESATNPAGYVDEQLALARHYTMLGDVEEAGEACRRVLAIDPANQTAKEILAGHGVQDAEPPVQPPPPPEPVPEIPAEPGGELDLALDAGLGGGTDAIPLDLSAEAGDEPVLDPMDAMEAGEAGALELDDPPAEEGAPAPSEETAGKISTLLSEGDRLLAEGKFEEAIDSWSRIFILQDDHAEAELRIDDARKRLDRRARKMEEHLARGEDLISKGMLQDARLEFEAVLRIRDGHAEAVSRIDFIDRGLGGEISAVQLAPPAPEAPAPPAAEPAPSAPPTPAEVGLDLDPESRLPTPPPAPPKRPTDTTPAGRKLGAPVIGAVVVVIVAVIAAGSYFAWQKFFPTAPAPLAGDPAGSTPEPGTPAEGQVPAEEGSGDAAPVQAEATQSPAPAPVEPAAPSEAERKDLAARAQREGISRYRAGDFEAAIVRFREALELEPTDFETQDWLTKAEAEHKKMGEFDRELGAVRQGFTDKDYRSALYKLYRIEAPDDKSQAKVDRWILACWYDWGVTLLKAGNTKEAEEKFREVIGLNAADREATQNLEVALRYQQLPIDQAYRTYTERLTPRPLD